MILTLYSAIIIASTLIILLAQTPIVLGINILLISLLLSMIFASFISSWYSFLIFLIYVGGMLVMFSYFLALIPNQQIVQSSTILYYSITVVIILSTILITKITPPTAPNYTSNLTYLYYSRASPILIILASILLLTIIIVVKIALRSKGPLRPFIKYV